MTNPSVSVILGVPNFGEGEDTMPYIALLILTPVVSMLVYTINEQRCMG